MSTIGVLIGYSQHLVLVQCGFQGDITQCGIQCVFAVIEQSSRLNLLIIFAQVHIRQVLHHRTNLLNITDICMLHGQSLIERVRFVIRHSCSRSCTNRCVQNMLWIILAQVGQRHDITCLIIIATFVGYPHFNAVNRHTTRNIRQRLHSLLIIVAEIITQEEVAILVIAINWYLKAGCLCTTFTRNGLTFRVLLRNQCLHFQFTKLQIGLDTK